MSTALVTGASRGLGKALASALADRDWSLILDARGADTLDRVVAELSSRTSVSGISGDVSDPAHRLRLAKAAASAGRLDLLVNNASALGPSPLPALEDADLEAFQAVLATNVVAPLALYQLVAPLLSPEAIVVNVTSDASVEAYPRWGLYAASKAALDRLSAVMAAERPELAVYAFDPGDMRTQMHQEAFPGKDISDRPEPEEVIPAFLRLIGARPPSGRVIASEISTPLAS